MPEHDRRYQHLLYLVGNFSILISVLIFIMLTWLLVNSCARIQRFNRGSEEYHYDFVMTTPRSSDMHYTDDTIDITFNVFSKAITFILRNTANDTLQVVWDKTSIAQFGNTYKATYVGAKPKDLFLRPSVIPIGGWLKASVYPKNKLAYRNGYPVYLSTDSILRCWDQEDMFPTRAWFDPVMRDVIIRMKGTTFSLYLPIQRGNQAQEYIFTFMVADVKPQKEN